MSKFSCALAGLLFAFPWSVLAGYPAAKRNQDLRPEFTQDRNRIVTDNDYFSLGADGMVAYRHLPHDDYFHGINYWLQLRTEARPHEYVALNLRSIFYGGSISYGYARPGGSYHLFGVTGRLPYQIAGGESKLRVLDLDRQTFGRGLLVQDKEINGALFEWKKGSTAIIARVDGTGVFNQTDDTSNLEASFLDGKIGGGHLWNETRPMGYVFHSMPLNENFGYDVELGYRPSVFAGLMALKAQTTGENYRLTSRLEGRRYGRGFGRHFVRDIEPQYISFDQLDKPFTNAQNVFVYGDDANVAALNVDFQWNPEGIWRPESLLEVGGFFYARVKNEPYYFFRQEIGYCPIENRDDCLIAAVSNKVMTANYILPPNAVSVRNAPLFRRVVYFSVEGKFRF